MNRRLRRHVRIVVVQENDEIHDFSHVAAYTNNPNYPGAMFFDPETMDAQVNNPGWVKGLEEYIRTSKLGPRGSTYLAAVLRRTDMSKLAL